jgi:hypothetical protein
MRHKAARSEGGRLVDPFTPSVSRNELFLGRSLGVPEEEGGEGGDEMRIGGGGEDDLEEGRKEEREGGRDEGKFNRGC